MYSTDFLCYATSDFDQMIKLKLSFKGTLQCIKIWLIFKFLISLLVELVEK